MLWLVPFATRSSGRAVAKAVSRWLPTAAPRVRVQAELLRVLRFPLPIIIFTRGWQNRPTDGRSAQWTQLDSTPHYTNLKKLHAVPCM
jgi:hypothetical protein